MSTKTLTETLQGIPVYQSQRFGFMGMIATSKYIIHPERRTTLAVFPGPGISLSIRTHVCGTTGYTACVVFDEEPKTGLGFKTGQ